MTVRLAAVVLAGMLSACGSIPSRVSDLGPAADTLAVADVPFYPQERFQCGPAALTTILDHSGADVSIEEITERVYLPALQGSLQTELLAATRGAGRIPYQIDGSLSAIAGELAAGRPVLVMQNLGVSWWPRWHYAVVVSIDPVRGRVTLRSGTDRERETRIRTFLHTWKRSDYWAFVALRPDRLPASPDKSRYFEAVAALEATGHLEQARTAWATARDAWPGALIPLFGLANVALARDEPAEAERLYRQLLQSAPTMVSARNNLAHALARQGKYDAAIRELERGMRDAGDDPAMLTELQDSLDSISQSRK